MLRIDGRRYLRALALAAACWWGCPNGAHAQTLEQGWANPPREARLRAYWWWLNGCVTKEAITRDLEEMKAKGFGGALLCDAGGAEQDGNDRVPHGPTFLTAAWRDLYRHALREADRLGLEMSLNIQSGWNLGGPVVPARDAAKKLVWRAVQVSGPKPGGVAVAEPAHRDPYYEDRFVLAYPLRDVPDRRPLRNLAEKAMLRTLHASAPDTSPLLTDDPPRPGEEDTYSRQVRDLTGRLGQGGTLRWAVPPGTWEVVRIGCTVGDNAHVSTSSDGWKGYALDVLDRGAFRRYWDAVVEPLIADAGPLAGRTLRYLHTDSWEVEAVNWTPTLRQEFRRRRGYDLVPWLPVIVGRIVDGRMQSNRFLNDFRKTLGDLAVDNHFRPFARWAHRHGLGIHPESGGPHAVPIDAQRCLGVDDAPMSEFWAESWRHRIGDQNRFFVKQPASAAHTYGHRLVMAEGFTTIGPHWQETLWDNLKPSFDKAACEGMNLLVWHAFVCSPAEMGLPGIQYFAGTHLNPNTTWWSLSAPFFAYIDRCQWMLQRGRFVADALFYYGDHVPNFAQLRSSDPAHLGAGFDYDVLTEEALLTRLRVRDRKLCLPGGGEYRVLVIPDRKAISLPVLRKLRELVEQGAVVVGPPPEEATTLRSYPACDEEVRRLAGELWRTGPSGKGRVVADRTAREVLLAGGVPEDFAVVGGDERTDVSYIHRRDGAADIYFVANRDKRPEALQCTFRVSGKAPELWDPVTAERRFASDYDQHGGRTTVPLEFAPCGSWFVVFRESATSHPPTGAPNEPHTQPLLETKGPWSVRFDPRWGGPGTVEFGNLVSWTERPEPGICYYSGTAVYSTRLQVPANALAPGRRLWLDLGRVRELAEVKLNGRNLGVVWSPPFRVDVTDALRAGANDLVVEVVNFWPNRIIGDQSLPPSRRLTQTNIRKLTADTKLMESGLLGPVRVCAQE